MKELSQWSAKGEKVKPIVTVICTCYNQGDYVAQALDSVLAQTYRPLSLTIIDNGSSDHSKLEIKLWLDRNSHKIPVKSIYHKTPINYCKSFNQALANSNGDFLVDLAADDFFNARHLEFAVKQLLQSEAKVYFCNALEHLPNGETQPFYPTDNAGKANVPVVEGNVFAEVIKRYVISSPTLVMDQKAFKDIGCYDEHLSYEDFDILVRMAARYSFVYGDFLGVNKRILKESLSQQQYRSKKSQLLPSTFIVCEKIAEMLSTEQEKEALRQRLIHEIKHATVSANFDVALKMLKLYKKGYPANFTFLFFYVWAKVKCDLSPLYEKWRRRSFN
ncbi:glycosyltransferase [uncultured Cyclobacterium sp.]|uniref:glycosyltransferase n=1 Tax=uncultured Cyclobacterium sp. TaxID=453820 RepID=UPI0030EDF868|tara:strand:- start:108231 stop:109226 length:996 start_codon:yes stop_codon:yes gene_type:complete